MNFLEQLAAEWYQYNEYLVRTNIRFGKNARGRGGHIGEIDVIAFKPEKNEFIHIETSTDSDSWRERKKKFSRKFAAARRYYLQEFSFKTKDIRPEMVAIVGLSRSREVYPLGRDIKYYSIPSFVSMIAREMRNKDPRKDAMPESYPLMRAIQYAVKFMPRAAKN